MADILPLQTNKNIVYMKFIYEIYIVCFSRLNEWRKSSSRKCASQTMTNGYRKYPSCLKQGCAQISVLVLSTELRLLLPCSRMHVVEVQ